MNDQRKGRFFRICMLWLFTAAVMLMSLWAPATLRAAEGPSREGETASESPRLTHKKIRRYIRSLPLLQRPNRPGHFYGNTVRRRHARHHR